MKQLLLVGSLLTAVAMTTVACAADASDPAGTWRLKTDFGGRSFISMLKLEWDGEELTGVLVRPEGRETELEDLSLEDESISFKTTREWNGRRFVTSYSGTFRQDAIVGKTEIQRGDETRVWRWQAKRADGIDLAPRDEAPPVDADIAIDDQNYEVWRNHILPDEDELAWKRIPWLSTFKDGILAADAAQKPLLLWTMNGHPLGCT